MRRMHHLPFLFGAGLLAGGMNALAGGGSFVSLPALIAAGVPSVVANASNTVALFPGGLASAWTYHERLQPVCGIAIPPLLVLTLAGGLLGSLLLLWTPASAFNQVLPWLLLIATLALAFARRIGAALEGRLHARAAPVLFAQFLLAIYGGYFGGAVGLMMVAAWCVLGERDIKRLNAPRTLLVSAANGIAVLAFIAAGAIRWPETLAMLAGGLCGGYAGARLGRAMPPQTTRALTLCWSIGITCVFFIRAYRIGG
jgi:uncharacterized membrane protein YfcA